MLGHFPELRDGNRALKFKSTKSPLLKATFIDPVSKHGSLFSCYVENKYQSKEGKKGERVGEREREIEREREACLITIFMKISKGFRSTFLSMMKFKLPTNLLILWC